MVAKKIKVKVGAHRPSYNMGPYLIFGRKKAIDGIRAPFSPWPTEYSAQFSQDLIEGPYTNKPVWKRLKEMIKR